MAAVSMAPAGIRNALVLFDRQVNTFREETEINDTDAVTLSQRGTVLLSGMFFFTWIFPLSHTWIVLRDSRLFETGWVPLHFAWIVVCGFALVLLALQQPTVKGALTVLAIGTALSYAVTGLGAYFFSRGSLAGGAVPDASGWEVPFFAAEMLALALAVWWMGQLGVVTASRHDGTGG